MSESIKDQGTSSEHGNVGRRRVVRGAMALAPLVLTLRSGALAAASCTGAKAVSYNIPQSGDLPSGTNPGDVCVTGLQACGDHKVVTNPLSIQEVQVVGSNNKCQGFQTKTVAILSATSASSMGINLAG